MDEEKYTTLTRKDHAHCVELVKSRDREGYLCGLLMPKQSRVSYFALRALNIEIASIKDSSNVFSSNHNQVAAVNSSFSIGSKLRMKWWRDAINEIYKGSERNNQEDLHMNTLKTNSIPHTLGSNTLLLEHPIVRSLQYVVREKKLTRRFIDRMLDTRDGDLGVMQLETMDELVRYSEMTVSSLLYLTLECCDVVNDDADDMAYNIGIGIGIVNAIRSIAYRTASNSKEIAIPKDMMIAYKVSGRTLKNLYINSEKRSETEKLENHALREVVKDMSNIARFYLQHGRQGQRHIPKNGRICFLPAVVSLNYLDMLEDLDYDIFNINLISADSLHNRIHAIKNMMYLSRAWFTGVF